MTPDAIDRLESHAQTQAGLSLGTMVALTPGELLALIRLARVGMAQEFKGADPE